MRICALFLIATTTCFAYSLGEAGVHIDFSKASDDNVDSVNSSRSHSRSLRTRYQTNDSSSEERNSLNRILRNHEMFAWRVHNWPNYRKKLIEETLQRGSGMDPRGRLLNMAQSVSHTLPSWIVYFTRLARKYKHPDELLLEMILSGDRSGDESLAINLAYSHFYGLIHRGYKPDLEKAIKDLTPEEVSSLDEYFRKFFYDEEESI